MVKSFCEILTLYLKEGNLENKPKSRKRDEVCAVPLRQFFKGWRVSGMGGEKVIVGKKVSEYREWRKAAGVSVQTIAREIVVASCAIRYCVRDLDWDLENPFKERAYSKRDRKLVVPRMRNTTQDEIDMLLREASPLLRDLIEFYLETGMRVNEALNLKRIRVVGDVAIMGADDHKGGFGDARFLNDAALQIINRQPAHEYVFSDNGLKVSYWMIRNQWRQLRKRCGIPDINMQDLRKLCGQRARDRYGLDVAQGQLGHKTRSTTEGWYTRVSADSVRNALLRSSNTESQQTLSPKGIKMVPETGIEPATYALRMPRLIH